MKLTRCLTVLVITSACCATSYAQSESYPAELCAAQGMSCDPSSGCCDPGMCMPGCGGEGYCDGGYCGGGHCGGYCGEYSGPNGCFHCFGHGGRVHRRTGRGYVAIDALLLNRSRNCGFPLLVTATSPVTSGATLNDAGTSYGFETLPRITAGYVLPNDNAVEATYFYKDDFDTHLLINGPLHVGTPPPTPVLTSTYNAANAAQLNLRTRVQNFELNLVETGRTVNFLLGARWFELRDRSQVIAFKGANNGLFEVDTYNGLFGGQGGVRVGHNWGLFGIEAQGKAGFYVNYASATSRATSTATAGGGGFAVRSRDGNAEAFIGELSAKVTYRPTSTVNLYAGYQVFWLCNTALATDQIARVSPLANTGLGIMNQTSNITFHGPSAGAEFRW